MATAFDSNPRLSEHVKKHKNAIMYRMTTGRGVISELYLDKISWTSTNTFEILPRYNSHERRPRPPFARPAYRFTSLRAHKARSCYRGPQQSTEPTFVAPPSQQAFRRPWAGRALVALILKRSFLLMAAALDSDPGRSEYVLEQAYALGTSNETRSTPHRHTRSRRNLALSRHPCTCVRDISR